MTRTPPFLAKLAARSALCLFGVLATACGGSTNADDTTKGETSADTGETGNADGVTYYEDVAPIVVENCVGCHVSGGIAPFKLESYEDASMWAEQMAYMTGERLMPPFPIDASGDCNTYADSAWLAQEDIDTIQAWVDDGVLEGDPANAPELPPPPAGLTDVTHVAQMAEPYTPDPPAGGPDDYRCFLVDPGLDADAFLTGYEVAPGDARFVHHVVVFQATSQTGADQAQQKDDADPDYGYTCFGDAGLTVPTALVAAWAPGKGAWEYPDGSGIHVSADYPLIMQVHYNVETDPKPDTSEVRLRFEDQVDRPMVSWFLGDFDLLLQPGESEVFTEVQARPVDMMDLWGVGHATKGMEVVGLFPHMHNRGIQFFLENQTDETCYGYLPRWDFNWQFLYFFENPIPISPTDNLRLACSYDTSEDSEPVPWGDGTEDEMCLVAMFTSYEP